MEWMLVYGFGIDTEKIEPFKKFHADSSEQVGSDKKAESMEAEDANEQFKQVLRYLDGKHTL